MTFNKQAANVIRNNAEFIAHIEILSHSQEVGLQRVAESVLWKLANEDPIKTDTQEKKKQNESGDKASPNKSKVDVPSTNNKHEYDIMIVSLYVQILIKWTTLKHYISVEKTNLNKHNARQLTCMIFFQIEVSQIRSIRNQINTLTSLWRNHTKEL